VETIKQLHNTYKEAREVFEQSTVEKQAIRSIIKDSKIEIVEAEQAEAQKPQAETLESEPETEPDKTEEGDE
jgi:hypothetical protein